MTDAWHITIALSDLEPLKKTYMCIKKPSCNKYHQKSYMSIASFTLLKDEAALTSHLPSPPLPC